MGPRRGGGRSGFVKATRSKPGGDGSDGEAPAPQPPAPAPQAGAEPQGEAQGVPSKAAAFLKDPPPAQDAGSDSEEDGEPGVETRGKMLQRHKREQKALKDQAKKMGKKGKDEVLRLEAEMDKRHAAELASLEGAKERTVAEAVAVAGSLYAVHLGGGGGGEEGEEGEDGEPFKKASKQSKSQRRREQRQREEAEREARIAAELEALGDTDRVLEERALQATLAPLGLSVSPIPADGHCLYRSLEDQLGRLPEGVPPPPAAEGEEEGGEQLSFLHLRQRAAAYLRAHADTFKPFVLEEDVEASGGDDQFEAYCAELEGTAAWGGQVELQALAQDLRCHIVVYSVGLPVLEMGEEHKGTGRTLRLCYLRHAFGLGEHYESVVEGVAAGADEDEEAAAEQQADADS